MTSKSKREEECISRGRIVRLGKLNLKQSGHGSDQKNKISDAFFQI